MKSLTIINILGCFILALIVVVTGNNITWGYIGPYDRILATDNIVKPRGWFGKQTAEVVYPPRGHISYVTLSAIRVYDWGGKKNFGYASLIRGGPRYRNATIYLKSQSGKPLNFTLQYFGH